MARTAVAATSAVDAAQAAVTALTAASTDAEVEAVEALIAAARAAVAEATSLSAAERAALDARIAAVELNLAAARTAIAARKETDRQRNAVTAAVTAATSAVAALTAASTDAEVGAAEALLAAAKTAVAGATSLSDAEKATLTASIGTVELNLVNVKIAIASRKETDRQRAAATGAVDAAAAAVNALTAASTDEQVAAAEVLIATAKAAVAGAPALSDAEKATLNASIGIAETTLGAAKTAIAARKETERQRLAVTTAITAAADAVAALTDASTSAQVTAAEALIAAARTAVTGATALSAAEKVALTASIATTEATLASTKTAIAAKRAADAEGMRIARAIEHGSTRADSDPGTEGNQMPFTIAAGVVTTTDPDTPDNKTDDLTKSPAGPVGIAGWTGTIYTRTTAAPGSTARTEDRVVSYHDRSPPGNQAWLTYYSADDAGNRTAVSSADAAGVLTIYNSEVDGNHALFGNPRTFGIIAPNQNIPAPVDNSETDLNEALVSFIGTFHGIAGTYSCPSDCTRSSDSEGNLEGLGGTWTFTPTSASTAVVLGVIEDADYLDFGYWLRTTTAGDGTVNYAVLPFAEGSRDYGGVGAVEGRATYAGRATGLYVRKTVDPDGTPNRFWSGQFTAAADLTTTFGGTAIAADDHFKISGTVSGFRDDAGGVIDSGWTVRLMGEQCHSEFRHVHRRHHGRRQLRGHLPRPTRRQQRVALLGVGHLRWPLLQRPCARRVWCQQELAVDRAAHLA